MQYDYYLINFFQWEKLLGSSYLQDGLSQLNLRGSNCIPLTRRCVPGCRGHRLSEACCHWGNIWTGVMHPPCTMGEYFLSNTCEQMKSTRRNTCLDEYLPSRGPKMFHFFLSFLFKPQPDTYRRHPYHQTWLFTRVSKSLNWKKKMKLHKSVIRFAPVKKKSHMNHIIVSSEAVFKCPRLHLGLLACWNSLHHFFFNIINLSHFTYFPLLLSYFCNIYSEPFRILQNSFCL